MLIDAILGFLPAVVGAGLVAFVLSLIVNWTQTYRKTENLGGFAKEIRTKFFGIDETFKILRAAKERKDRELWTTRFKALGAWTLDLYVVGERVILTADPENIKAVLATQFEDFGKGKDFHDKWHAFLGDSIFTSDGQLWHEARALIRPQFIKDRVSDLQTFEQHFQRMLPHIPTDGSTFEASSLFYRLTLDSSTDFLFGQSVDSLQNPKAEFARSFSYLQYHQDQISHYGPLSFLIAGSAEFKKHLKVLNDFVEPFVQRTLQLGPEDLKGKSESDYNFLHELAQYTRDPRMLRDQLVAVLLAARDTTAAHMSWGLYELARHPECIKRLRKEILDRVGPVNPPTYQDLKDMKYLQHVISETLRLYPGVPVNIRVALKDTTLPRGNIHDESKPIAVLAGTSVAYSVHTMQRREDLFGDDVNEFKPDRWETWQPKPWHYLPFNGGPRLCVGQQFALTEIGYFWTRFFQMYESVETRSPGLQEEKIEIVLTPGKPVDVAVKLAAVE